MAGLRFDNRVVVVTGAGGGLGRVYALDFASRGAKVVVNDLGGSTTGEGGSTRAADNVVDEIKKAGGQAVANYDSVTDGAKIIKTAIDAFGRVDVVINNAGILRDVSFIKMEEKQWEPIYQVHLKGAYSVTRAAWPYMLKQGYGRIIVTASAAGLYGNFGQAAYSAMKLALVGFSNTLSLEGAKKNVFCNVIAPIAASRMTESLLPPDLLKVLKPEMVSPLVQYLCHEKSASNGGIFEVGAGWVAQLRWERSKGVFFPASKPMSLEALAKEWEKVGDFADADHPKSLAESLGTIMAKFESAGGAAPAKGKGKGGKGGKKPAKKSTVDTKKALAHPLPDSTFEYNEKDVALYALGVGASAADPLSPKQLQFVYEGAEGFATLPTFGVIIAADALKNVTSIPGLEFNPMMLLHGEQYLEVKKPLPVAAKMSNKSKITGLYDKGKGALLCLGVSSSDDSGKEILFNEYSLFIRGIGGFGGDKGPKAPNYKPPARAPDVVHREQTRDNQALLYRLNGDLNPLHADPAMAAVGGFSKPILHGLCSFGYAARAVIENFANYDVSRFKSIRVRFSSSVYPGETIVTEMWQTSPTQVVFRCKVAERGAVVLDNCCVELFPAAPKAKL